jgi:hypothetical protein
LVIDDQSVCQVDSSGAQWWRLNGTLHRIGGPAVIHLDIVGRVRCEQWFRYGERHREDGPAIVYPNNECNDRWFVDGKKIECNTQEEFERWLRVKAFW